MTFKKHLPNAITMCNLFSGCIAVFYAVIGSLDYAALFVVIGIVFDFFDGFAARILKVQGELGKQLDSLADMVTSGLVPGIVLFQLLLQASSKSEVSALFQMESFEFLPFLGLIVTLASAYRLANFNIDTRQTTSFIGLPTPANTLLIVSLPLIIEYSDALWLVDLLRNQFVLVVLVFLSSYFLNANIPLFALKFKSFAWRDNSYKYVFLGFSIILLFAFQYAAIPLVIFSYLLFSMVYNYKHNIKL
ncbi:MAG: CDP-alcohol phosphatidyltransferase family protein [Flavicella sp.]